MRKPYVTTGVLFIGFIALLGAIGIVNGLWSKNLVINGTVTTGDLNADWDCGYTNDDGNANGGVGPLTQGSHPCTDVTEPAGDNGLDPRTLTTSGASVWGTQYDGPRKDVGKCRIEQIGDKDTSSAGFGDQVAYVNLINAYPSYECTVTFFISNTGSIPFNFAGSDLVIDEGVPLETLPGGCVYNAASKQIDPGKEGSLSCTVHVKQEAAQNTCTAATTATTPFVVVSDPTCNSPLTMYSFKVKTCVAQWNEEADYTACTLAGTAGHPGTHEGPP